MKNGAYKVDYEDARHKAALGEVWKWAAARPEIYLHGSGYCSVEDFCTRPACAIEYLISIDGRLEALLTFIRKSSPLRMYQVGLIVRPGAPYRRLLRILDGFRAYIADYADVLQVELPVKGCFDGARKLARRFRFEPIASTEFILVL